MRPEASASPGASRATGNRKHTIRVVPDFYMPGKRNNPGDPPLKGMREVADEFERLHPDTRIEFLDAPVGQREWLVTQLASGQAPDIINVNVENVWQDVQKGWYVPLDDYLEAPNRFANPGEPGSRQWWDAFQYQAISRGKAGPDGRMYCITLDMIETGIFYNKKIFNELGLQPPKDWEEFRRIQQKIKEAGYVPMLADMPSLADWGVDLIFDQLYRDIRPVIDLRSDPKRADYLKGYLDWDEIAFLNRKGFFTKEDSRWREVFRTLKSWRAYMPKDIGSVDNVREFVQGRAGMIWSSSLFVPRLKSNKSRTFDYGIFYLPPLTKETSPYASGVDQCVIGGAATQLVVTNSAFNDTGDMKNSEKLERTIDFLRFITMPKQADRIVNEQIALLPNTVGVQPQRELQDFAEILKRDYTTTKWVYTFDLRFSEIVNRMLYLFMVDGATEEEFMDWMDKNVRSATTTIARRKKLDFAPLEAEWQARADQIAKLADLPKEAR